MIQFDQIPAPPAPTGAPPWETLPPEVFAIVAVAVVIGGVLLFWPLLRALARRIEGRGGETAVRGELDELRRRLDAAEQHALGSGEVEASVQRLEELEERLDFMERVLSSGRDGEGR